MFRAHSAHHQEVHDADCTYAASGIVTVCRWMSCATAPHALPIVKENRQDYIGYTIEGILNNLKNFREVGKGIY